MNNSYIKVAMAAAALSMVSVSAQARDDLTLVSGTVSAALGYLPDGYEVQATTAFIATEFNFSVSNGNVLMVIQDGNQVNATAVALKGTKAFGGGTDLTLSAAQECVTNAAQTVPDTPTITSPCGAEA